MRKIWVSVLAMAVVSTTILTIIHDAKVLSRISANADQSGSSSVSSYIPSSSTYCPASSDTSSASSSDSSSSSSAPSESSKPSSVPASSSSQPSSSSSPSTPPDQPTPISGTSSPIAGEMWYYTDMRSVKIYEYGKSQLNAEERSCYSQFVSALSSVQGSVSISTTLNLVTMKKILWYVISDHAELFYFKEAQIPQNAPAPDSQGHYNYSFSFIYNYGASAVGSMKSAIASKIGPWLSQAAQYSSDFEKEKYLHDALIDSCSYDYAAAANPVDTNPSFSVYGALVNGQAVCQGYAKAMKLLLDSAGVRSVYITGTASNGVISGAHGWNAVYIANKWYYLDSTFDDTNGSASRYTYFNFLPRSDHSLGTFNPSDPFGDGSQNYASMPSVG